MTGPLGSESACNVKYSSVFKELPYFNVDLIRVHGQFNNNIGSQLPTKKYLDKLSSLYDMDLFSLNTDSNLNPDCNFSFPKPRCQYFSPHSFSMFKNTMINNNDANFSLLHNNVRSLKRNLENFQVHLLDELDYHFSVIGVTETKITRTNVPLDFNPNLPNYEFDMFQHLYPVEVLEFTSVAI